MSERAVAISLKIPDNAAYTASVALRSLGIEVGRVERSEVWHVEDDGDVESFARRIEHNESIFNPNTHRVSVLDEPKPRAGEAWIETIGAHDEVREYLGGKKIAGITRARRYVGWRLFDVNGDPVNPDLLAIALDRLLCNPAIEKAQT